jgi:hypothetical protein
MKKQVRFALFLMALIAMLLLVAVPVAARAKKTEVEAIDYGCQITDPGVMWIDDEGFLHIRGQKYEGIAVSDDPRFDGVTAIDDASMNMDMATGDYNMHGTGSLVPSDPGIDGMWEVMFNSHMVGGVLTARGVLHGSGDLEGLKGKVTIEMPDGVPEPNPCEAAPAYVGLWTVTVLDPHGE